MVEKHPLLVPRGIKAKTRPLLEFASEFTRLAVNGEFSMHVCADSGSGKTTAMEYLQDRLTESKAKVPFVCHVANFDQRGEAAKFFRSIVRVPGTPQFEPTSPFQALVNRVRIDCDMFETADVVFMMDEAQAMNQRHFDMLKLLADALIRLGLCPFFLLFGQPPLANCPDELLKQHRKDLVTRFFRNPYWFRGLRKQDFVEFLTHYDTACWPEEKSAMYTEHFVPDAWKRGWRLSGQGLKMWSVFEQVATEMRVDVAGFKDGLEVSTEYAARAAKVLLLGMAAADQKSGQELIVSAVEQSGFRQGLDIQQRYGKVVEEQAQRGKKPRARALP